MKEMRELKPCPFCGAEADSPENVATATQRSRWMISCTQHCVAMYRSTRAEVMKSWNTRFAAARASEGGWIDARNQALREAAIVASHFTMGTNARIHPDIAWEEMNESAKLVAHTTAQQISWAISELITDPPLSVETPEPVCKPSDQPETPKPLVEEAILNDICKNASSSQRLYFELASELQEWRKYGKSKAALPVGQKESFENLEGIRPSADASQAQWKLFAFELEKLLGRQNK